MNTTDVHLLRDFYTRCLNDGFYHFFINGKNYFLESDSDIEPMIQAILIAPKEIQEYRIRQANTHIGRLRPA